MQIPSLIIQSTWFFVIHMLFSIVFPKDRYKECRFLLERLPILPTNIFFFSFFFFFFPFFSTGLVKLILAGLPLRSCLGHWGTFCAGGHPKAHFRCCHWWDSNPCRCNLYNKSQCLNDIGHCDPPFIFQFLFPNISLL